MAELNARIIAKASATTGEEPVAGDLEVAELAVNTADGKLFTKHTDNSIVTISGGGGGGAVDSVNGQTGVVSLGIQDMNDFSLLPGEGPSYNVVSDTPVPGDGNGSISSVVGGDWIFDSIDRDGNDRDSEWGATGNTSGVAVDVFVDNVLVSSTTFGSNTRQSDGRQIINTADTSWYATAVVGSVVRLNSLIFNSIQPPLADGDILQWVDADQKFKPAQLNSGGSRSVATVTTSSLASGASQDVTLTGTGKAGQFMSVTTDRPAWVVFYADEASRTADASRDETTSPSPGSGVLMEVITTAAETIIISPAVNYFNNESSPVASLPLKVTNKDASAQTVQVDVKLLPTEG